MPYTVHVTYSEMQDACTPQHIQHMALHRLKEQGAPIDTGYITVSEDSETGYTFKWTEEQPS